MDERIAPWMAERTTEEAMDALKGVPCGPVYDMRAVLGSRYVSERGVLWEMENTRAGAYKAVGCPIRFSEAQPRAVSGAPCLGEDNERVLGDILGYSRERLDALRENGVI